MLNARYSYRVIIPNKTSVQSSVYCNHCCQSEVSMTNIVFPLISTVMVITLYARPNRELIISPTLPIDFKCTGSLVIETKPGKIIRTTSSRTKASLNVRSAHIDGCGCFYVYRRPGFKSTSRLIHPAMKVVNGTYISFRVKSIEKVPCEEEIYWTTVHKNATIMI